MTKREEERRRKIAEARTGLKHTKETKARISQTMTGQTYNDAHRNAISEALKGKPKSAESNARRAQAARAYWASKRAAQEVRA